MEFYILFAVQMYENFHDLATNIIWECYYLIKRP